MTEPPSNHIVLQKPPKGRPAAEELLLANHAHQIGAGVLWLGRSELPKRVQDLQGAVLCSGDVPWVSDAMYLTEREVPEHAPYPAEAAHFLGRRVWREPHLYKALDKAALDPAFDHGLFVKPAARWKRFTGFVAERHTHRYDPRLNGYSRTKPVWCSEPIAIESEWRAYVLRDVVHYIARAPYAGDGPEQPEAQVVKQCTDIAVALRGKRAGYVFDVAIIRPRTGTGQRVVLLEVNDGFSFGAYGGVPADLIFQIQAARWNELSQPQAA
jgi:hypothetical protein